jgi:signal transduction histidine kinase/DNA-binding response OmpR family regulator/ligand-binding sensor domain-containing protein
VFTIRFRFLLFCLFLSTLGQSQEYQSQSIKSSDGLSQEYITAIFQDKKGFIWLGTYYGLNRYDGRQIKSYLPNHLGKWTLKSNMINHIMEDNQGILWISTEDGLALLDPTTEKFVHLEQWAPAYQAGFAKKAILADNGTVWLYQTIQDQVQLLQIQVQTNLKALFRKETQPKQAIAIKPFQLPSQVVGPLTLFFHLNPDNILLVDANGQSLELSTSQQLLRTTQLSEHGHPYGDGSILIENLKERRGFVVHKNHNYKDFLSMDLLNAFYLDPTGKRLFIPFYDTNITLLNPSNASNPQVLHSIDQPSSFAKLVDRQGTIWVGTIGYGVRKITQKTGGCRILMPGKVIYNLVSLPNQQVWPGCFEHQWLLNTTDGTTQPAPWTSSKSPNASPEIAALVPNQSYARLYLIERKKTENKLQLLQYDVNTKQLQNLNVPLANYSNSPPTLLEDQFQNIWIANSGGEIVRWSTSTNTPTYWNIKNLFPSELSEKVLARQMVQDAFQQIWIATNYGLVKISQINGEAQFRAWHNYSEKGTLFSNNGLLCLYPDPDGKDRVWLGTVGGGLALFDAQQTSIKYFSDQTSPSLLLSGMVPDANHNLWLSTSYGISCFNLEVKDFLNIQVPESISKANFNASSAVRLPNGEIGFGSSEGLFILKPEHLIAQEKTAQVHITQLKINGTQLQPESNAEKLEFSSEDVPTLYLNHDENSISLTLSAPEAQNLGSLQYRYRISTLSTNWIGLGKENTISLAGIPPGKYLVELQLVTLGHSENKAPISTLTLVVRPPWYRSWYAYLAYAGLLLSILGGFIQYDRKRIALRHESELSKQEMNRLAALDQLKSRFFAYIAHEFKTPLTIIMGLSELIKEGTHLNNPKEYAQPILRESKHMLRLIEEILDVSQLEDGSIQLRFERGNLFDFLQQTLATYHTILTSRQVQLEFPSTVPVLEMDFDPVRLRYILNNLLSNAIHYTPKGGHIRLFIHELTTETITLSLSDTGRGIEEDKLPFIFDKYFRATQDHDNTQHHGLGLSFVRELVLLMKGNIWVESTLHHGTTFFIQLPLFSKFVSEKELASPPLALPPNPELPVTNGPIDKDAPLLLVVDDNPTILEYLRICLHPHFHLLFAQNGEEGLKMAIEQIPDLLLSDVMMPVMDGLEMVQQLKQNPLTSHIPAVLLSAKSSLQDRLQGQQIGADSYLAKPFHNEELILTLKNLHLLQQTWKKRYQPLQSNLNDLPYQQPMPLEFEAKSIESTDQFMKNLYEVFEANFSSEAFDINQLCKLLHISRTQLYRKLASVSDQSAMELLKDYRLQKAMELLKNNPELGIKEVTYLVGFKERSHFSYSFTKKYNISPSDVRKNG